MADHKSNHGEGDVTLADPRAQAAGAPADRKSGKPGPTNLLADQGEVDKARKAEGEPLKSSDRYRDGKLTRKGMEAVIAEGGSVIHGGRTISNVDDLPSEAEVAEGDEAATLDALANLDRQQAAIDAQRARLTSASKSAKK